MTAKIMCKPCYSCGLWTDQSQLHMAFASFDMDFAGSWLIQWLGIQIFELSHFQLRFHGILLSRRGALLYSSLTDSVQDSKKTVEWQEDVSRSTKG